MTRAERGFTLLEVLAAVAVIGFAFTMLARANISALRAEGLAERRLMASLLADRILTELEASMAEGGAPPLGEREYSQEDFLVRLEVTPLILALPDADADGGGESDGSSLLAPGAASPLRILDLSLAWPVPGGEQRITRRTFAFDRTASASALRSLRVTAGADL